MKMKQINRASVLHVESPNTLYKVTKNKNISIYVDAQPSHFQGANWAKLETCPLHQN